MIDEHTDTNTTVTGAAPSVAVALKRAAAIAATNGRDWFGVEDLLAALLTSATITPLELHWQQRDLGALTFPELRELAAALVPSETPRNDGPKEPATVTFRATGPLAGEYTALVNNS
ncbi:hypothetical protein ACFO5K_25330 [Nocardia halotolerans]|uniref:Uncharacterized protein n=1 Tax=Nocardia halotolerans TaxID=1755878 RepID=A0ABV8VPV3_9NOCA